MDSRKVQGIPVEYVKFNMWKLKTLSMGFILTNASHVSICQSYDNDLEVLELMV